MISKKFWNISLLLKNPFHTFDIFFHFEHNIVKDKNMQAGCSCLKTNPAKLALPIPQQKKYVSPHSVSSPQNDITNGYVATMIALDKSSLVSNLIPTS